MERERIELFVDRVAAGGDALGRGDDGRVVFVTGALPGERIVVEIVEDKRQYRRGRAVEILEPVAGRVAPPCPGVAAGCGGCDWQHADPGSQQRLRREVVADALRRIGKLGEVAVEAGPELGSEGYRTVLRVAIRHGRAGFRAARTHETVVAERCVVAHPLAEELLVEGRFGSAAQARIVVGARTGERMVVLSGDDRIPPTLPPDVRIARSGSPPGDDTSIREIIHGTTLRISAESFFQCRPDGAEVLVDLVRGAAGPLGGARLLDAYAGVGLFATTVGPEADHVTAIEANPSSVADAEVNLSGAFGGDRSRWSVVRSRVERWQPDHEDAGPTADVVVADPSRRGLGRGGVAALSATGASTLVLVSCDPAALGRDARLLVDAGFGLERVVAVDLFGHTSHLEAVSVFRR